MEKINIDSRKVLGTIFGGIAFICCILFFTYAWYSWKSENTVFNGNIIDAEMPEPEPLGDITVSNIGPVLNISDGEKVEFIVRNNTTNAYNVKISLRLNSASSELLTESFKYAVVKAQTAYTEEEIDGSSLSFNYNSPIMSGNFSEITVGSTTYLGLDTLGSTMLNFYKIIFYIDGEMENDINMRGKSINIDVIVETTTVS